MAFKGEISAAHLNSIKTGFAVGDTYRIIDGGKLGGVAIPFGTFVEWKGTYWAVQPYTQLATTKDVNGVVNKWINSKSSTAGLYVPEEGEELHQGSIVTTGNGLIIITSQAQVDPDTGDVYYSYQTTDLANAVAVLESQGMIDLGEKTEDDLTDGAYVVSVPNSHTNLTLTTVAALTVKGNPGLGDFEILIDNSDNTNDVTVTVKSNNGQVTYLHSSAAGTDVAAGKIAQLTCVGNCWTLAEFEA